MNEPMIETTLQEVLGNSEKWPWSFELYLPSEEVWSPNTKSVLLDPDASEFEHAENEMLSRGLMYVLPMQTVQSISRSAKKQFVDPTSKQLMEAFLYYYDNDAFFVQP